MSGNVQVGSPQIVGISGSKTVGPFVLSGFGDVLQIVNIPIPSAGAYGFDAPINTSYAMIWVPVGNTAEIVLGPPGNGIPIANTGVVAILQLRPNVAQPITLYFSGIIPTGLYIEVTYW